MRGGWSPGRSAFKAAQTHTLRCSVTKVGTVGSCAAGPLQGPERPAKLADRQEVGMRAFSLQKRTDNTRDSLVTDPTTDLAPKSLSFRRRGVKKQGVSGSKNGRLFSSVSAVRFKKTANPGCATERHMATNSRTLRASRRAFFPLLPEDGAARDSKCSIGRCAAPEPQYGGFNKNRHQSSCASIAYTVVRRRPAIRPS